MADRRDRDPTKPPDPIPDHQRGLNDAIKALRDVIASIPQSLAATMKTTPRDGGADAVVGGSVGYPGDPTGHAPNSDAARQYRESRKQYETLGQILRDARSDRDKSFTNISEYNRKHKIVEDAERKHSVAESAYHEARRAVSREPAESRHAGVFDRVRSAFGTVRDAMRPQRVILSTPGGIPVPMGPSARPDPGRFDAARERVDRTRLEHEHYSDMRRRVAARRDKSLNDPDVSIYENLDKAVSRIDEKVKRARERHREAQDDLLNLPPMTWRQRARNAAGSARSAIGENWRQFKGIVGNDARSAGSGIQDAIGGIGSMIDTAARTQVRNWQAAFLMASRRTRQGTSRGNLLEELAGFKAVPKAIYDSLDATYGHVARQIYNSRPVQQMIIARRMFARAARGGWTPIPIRGLPAFGARAGHAFRAGVQGFRRRFGAVGRAVSGAARRAWNAPYHMGQVMAAVGRGRASPLPGARGLGGIGAILGNFGRSLIGLYNPMMALKAATIGAVIGFSRLSDRMAESNAAFQGFSAQYNYQLAQLHMGDFNRAMQFSRATEDTASELLKANNALRNARLPLEIAWNNLINTLMTHGTNFLAGLTGGIGGAMTPEGGFKGTSIVDILGNARKNVDEGNNVKGIGQFLGEMPSTTLGGIPMAGFGMIVAPLQALLDVGTNIELIVAKLVGNFDRVAEIEQQQLMDKMKKENLNLPLDEFTRAMGGAPFMGPGGMVPPAPVGPVPNAAAGGFAGALPGGLPMQGPPIIPPPAGRPGNGFLFPPP